MHREPPGDDDAIIQYLLGRLPDKEAERLDELSITDDDFALRLNAAEYDLVDAYVRGELRGETGERFRSFYLSSPKRREKVRLAETMLAREKKAAAAGPSAKPARAVGRVDGPADRFARKQRRGFFQLTPQWGFAAAALLLLIATASLLVENRRMRTQMAQTEAERAKLTQLQQELNRRLQEQPSTDRGTVAESQGKNALTAGGASNNTQSKAPMASIASFVLAPARRGAEGIPTIAVPRGTTNVRIKLELEANDFSRYRITLKDPVAGREVWHSAELTVESDGQNRAISVMLPARLLKQQNYLFELNGITGGAPELITSYPFRFVVK